MPRIPKGDPRRGGRVSLGGTRLGRVPAPLGVLAQQLIPQGPAFDTLQEWLDEGLHVELYKRLGGAWMIRVGDRELSVEEYLLLFDEDDER